jgi:transposase-like protein
MAFCRAREDLIDQWSGGGSPVVTMCVAGPVPSESEAWASTQLEGASIEVVPISDLVLDGSPRSAGVDPERVRAMAEVVDDLPPIVVHGPSRRVIDGAHRLHAAQVVGRHEITAYVHQGSDRDAFVLSVKLNISHGLPLSRADRTAAAERVIGSHPEWSNRMIAAMTGLAATTVAVVRDRCAESRPEWDSRLGQDGRVRPVNAAEGRRRARELMIERPGASVREIAREAGIAPSTVHDVRQRLARGQDPVPTRHRRAVASVARSVSLDFGRVEPAELTAALATLMRDPSIRLSDAGRFLLRWLDMNRAAMTGYERIIQTVPEHCVDKVAQLARGYATMWADVATRLAGRGTP